MGDKDRHGQDLRTVICTQCGLISHETPPSDEELADYYRIAYRSDYHGEFTPSAYRVLRAWRVGRRLAQRLRPFLQTEDRILEIGAGIGCNVQALQQSGFHAEGVEPHEGFQAFAERRLGAPVRRAALDDVPGREQYDFVLLVHVIEHFSDPRRELERIARLLKPGGRLYVECPNVEAPHAAPGKIFHFAHIYNFTSATLAMTAQSCGFERFANLYSAREPVLGEIFMRTPAAKLRLDSDSYRRTREGLERYNRLTYYARPGYAARRLQRAAEHVFDRIFARRRMQRMLDGDSQTPENIRESVSRAAA